MTIENWIVVVSYLFPVLVIVALIVESCAKSCANAATIRRLTKERNAAWEEIRRLTGERGRAVEVMENATDEFERLQAVVDRLPRDALGNVLMPLANMLKANGEPFHMDGVERDGDSWLARQWYWDTGGGEVYPCDKLYPTREAAEIAGKENQ